MLIVLFLFCWGQFTQAHNIVSVFQWDEVSVLDDRGKLIRTFEVCNVNQNPRQQDNWLATPFLYRHSAPRVFVTLRFSVRDCASLRSPSPACRETLTLYYKQADSQRELERTWVAEVRWHTGWAAMMHLILKMMYYTVVNFLSNSFTVVATHIKHGQLQSYGSQKLSFRLLWVFSFRKFLLEVGRSSQMSLDWYSRESIGTSFLSHEFSM